MQQLWLLKLDWNETLPPLVAEQWENFIKTLPHLEHIHVPRCFLKTDTNLVVLQGFSDASSKAYGAVIYIQTVSSTGEVNSTLLCSKSRVAPTKCITIPRLELCACLLLAKLTEKVLTAVKLQIDSVKLYSDSTIALAWIKTPSNLLKTFVGNRVSQIQQISKDFEWHHIPSEFNPADMISRGLEVKALAACELWWKGPDISKLNLPIPQTLQTPISSTDKLYRDELKTVSKVTLSLNNDSFFDNLLNISNNFHKLIRILAFIFRFCRRCKSPKTHTGELTSEEYERAENYLIKQVKYFPAEISALERGSSVPPTSKLKFFNHFLAPSSGLIRVGGRLSHSDLNFNRKHPVILPAGNKLVTLIFQYYHKRYFHVGPQALLNTVRFKYWPLGGRSTARKVVHECLECFKNKPIVAIRINKSWW
ncbi:uncharacterized protein LOC118205140 [Stegodyphus dumicola]|uniref:uncharacterized protein LOC118205140 n=1 Tax=Stegodyphus dumicola TaxID=202533 RepID=UPI0015B2659F|nr:uncharacterized protein LOC118205140 [Stegodyphus dumicola]